MNPNNPNIPAANAPQSHFKRLAIGDIFVSDANGTKGETFRKTHKTAAIRIKANGSGETHARIPFSRSHACIFVRSVT
jgi:hypothetical protein